MVAIIGNFIFFACTSLRTHAMHMVKDLLNIIF